MNPFRPQRRRPASTRVEVAVVIVLIASVIGCIIPGIQQGRGPSTRTQSTNNLKQIGLASHSFHDLNKRLPFNGVANDTEQKTVQYYSISKADCFTSGSWGFQISSYMDQGPMFTAGTSASGIAAFMDPGRGRPIINATPNPWSDYIINPWLNDDKAGNFAVNVDARRTLVDITDGTSNTVFYGHGAVNTRDYSTTTDTPGYLDTILKGGTGATAQKASDGFARDSASTPQNAARGWGGPYGQGCLMAMCDATVRMFPYALGKAGLQPFMTPTGKEEVTLPDT